MGRPVNISVPCGGDAFKLRSSRYLFELLVMCDNCTHYALFNKSKRAKCLGDRGWPILAHAAAEVARERKVTP
jgi:hypothetical protein